MHKKKAPSSSGAHMDKLVWGVSLYFLVVLKWLSQEKTSFVHSHTQTNTSASLQLANPCTLHQITNTIKANAPRPRQMYPHQNRKELAPKWGAHKSMPQSVAWVCIFNLYSTLAVKPLQRDFMETTSPAFSLIGLILIGLIALTGTGVYLSFGPPSKKLVDPWEADDD